MPKQLIEARPGEQDVEDDEGRERAAEPGRNPGYESAENVHFSEHRRPPAAAAGLSAGSTAGPRIRRARQQAPRFPAGPALRGREQALDSAARALPTRLP